MTVKERAKALVGDMPWVTLHFSDEQVKDLISQIAVSMHAAVREDREESVAKIRGSCWSEDRGALFEGDDLATVILRRPI